MQHPLFPLGKIVCLSAVLTCFTPAQTHAEEYRYDSLGRLIEITYVISNDEITGAFEKKIASYSYDKVGNRQEKLGLIHVNYPAPDPIPDKKNSDN